MISARTFSKSLRYAWRGLVTVFKHEHSFRVQLFALVALVVVSVLLGIRSVDAALLILVTMVVLVLELVNSVFERFIDIVEPRVGERVRDMKDIMAGAVLVSSLGALAVGLIVIIPYLTRSWLIN